MVLPAAAVARQDPPVINDAAVVDGWLTASVTTDGLEARARAEQLTSDGTWRVLSVTVFQGSTVRIELPALARGRAGAPDRVHHRRAGHVAGHHDRATSRTGADGHPGPDPGAHADAERRRGQDRRRGGA